MRRVAGFSVCCAPWRLVSFAAVVAATGLGVAACVSVDPRPDFARTEQMVAARTGVEAVYDPDTDAEVEDVVAALLDDGLTTDEAVQVALLNNREFQSLFQSIGVSRAEVVQSGLLTNPSVGISTRFPEGGGRSNLTLTFAQQVADLWLIPVRKKIAEAALEQTVLNIVYQAGTLALQVRRECYRVIALRQLEGIARDTAELADQSFKLAEDRFEAGGASKVDVNLARASVLSAKSRTMGLHLEFELAQTALAHMLGLARWRQPWTLGGALPRDTYVAGDESLLVFAMEQRLDARAAAMKFRAAEAEIERQYLRLFPNVTLGVEWERTEKRSTPGRHVLADTARASVANGRLTAPSIQSRGQRRQGKSQVIDSLLGPTLNITLPLWDQHQAKIAKAQYQAAAARKAYEVILDGVARDLHQAQAIAESASELVAFYADEALPHARLSVAAAQRAYQAGNVDILVLLDAQKTLVAQREAYLGVSRDFAIAMAELRRAAGGRLPSELDDEAGNNADGDGPATPNPETP